jgi:hypothetical protein
MAARILSETQRRLIEGAAALEHRIEGMRSANDALEKTLGEFRIGSAVRVSAVAPVDGLPELRVNGRVAIRFSDADGVGAAQESALRTFERQVSRELSRPRSRKELRQTVVFDAELVAQAIVEESCTSSRRS